MGNRNRKSEVLPVEPEDDLPLVDCHCHFPTEEKRRNMRGTYEEQYHSFFNQHKGQYMITSGGWWSFKYMLNFMKTHDRMYLTMGWGPQTVTYGTEEDLIEFPKYLDYLNSHPDEYVAIGECGLDFHHAKTTPKRNKQVEYFRKIIQATKKLNKPYVLHVRNPTRNDINQNTTEPSYNESDICNRLILEIIDEEKIPHENVMWHCFSGPMEWGPKLAADGYYISIPASTYGFKRWRRNIKGIPLASMLSETDASWQHPFKMGAYNTPANVKFAIAAIAFENNLKQSNVANIIVANAKKFYRLK